jgi:OmpA-OmpF porin, OOP family
MVSSEQLRNEVYMITNFKMKLSLVVAMAALAACASKPPNMQALPETADASAELESTQKMLNDAKDNNLDALAPKNFQRASDKLADAREYLVKGKSKEKILESIAESRGWLEQAQSRGEISRAAVKDLPDARSGAIHATAPALFAKEFKKLDDETKDLAAEAEKGNLTSLTKRGDKLTEAYHDLERRSVEKRYLSEAQINLDAAKKENAEKYSPKTYGMTKTKIDSVEALIKENPRNLSTIKKSAAEATEQSKFLLTVNQKTKAGNTEDLVLQSEKQKRMIGGMAAGMATTEAELAQTNATLAQKNAALQTADQIRKSLKPNEAEVFVENNIVKVRLKGVQFGSNSVNLNKKSADLLEKVDKVLGTVGASAITVEGHTDSVGSSEVNREISEKRAEAVQNYMVNKGSISANQVKAVGRGDESPISDNKTARGRAENRRIDLIIEPTVKTE